MPLFVKLCGRGRERLERKIHRDREIDIPERERDIEEIYYIKLYFRTRGPREREKERELS